MAVASTNTAELLFTSTEPAWEAGVELSQGMQTALFTSRSGLEQRQQRRIRGAYSIEYRIYHDKAAAALRLARNRAETVTAVVVPMWTEEAVLASLASNTATVSRTATEDWFSVGDYILLINGTTRQFRQIASYGVSLQALVLESDAGALAFPNGSRVIPCRICARKSGDSEMDFPSEDAVEEQVAYMTL